MVRVLEFSLEQGPPLLLSLYKHAQYSKRDGKSDIN